MNFWDYLWNLLRYGWRRPEPDWDQLLHEEQLDEDDEDEEEDEEDFVI